jgi:hypothetical protein
MANRKQRLEPTATRRSKPTLRIELPHGLRIDLYANAALRWLCRARAPEAPRLIALAR